MSDEPKVYIIPLEVDGVMVDIPCILRKEAKKYMGISETMMGNHHRSGKIRRVSPGSVIRRKLNIKPNALFVPLDDVNKVMFGDWKK